MMILNMQCRTETAIWAGATVTPPTVVTVTDDAGVVIVDDSGSGVAQD